MLLFITPCKIITHFIWLTSWIAYSYVLNLSSKTWLNCLHVDMDFFFQSNNDIFVSSNILFNSMHNTQLNDLNFLKVSLKIHKFENNTKYYPTMMINFKVVLSWWFCCTSTFLSCYYSNLSKIISLISPLIIFVLQL